MLLFPNGVSLILDRELEQRCWICLLVALLAELMLERTCRTTTRQLGQARLSHNAHPPESRQPSGLGKVESAKENRRTRAVIQETTHSSSAISGSYNVKLRLAVFVRQESRLKMAATHDPLGKVWNVILHAGVLIVDAL